jgi:hypothetical protein
MNQQHVVALLAALFPLSLLAGALVGTTPATLADAPCVRMLHEARDGASGHRIKLDAWPGTSSMDDCPAGPSVHLDAGCSNTAWDFTAWRPTNGPSMPSAIVAYALPANASTDHGALATNWTTAAWARVLHRGDAAGPISLCVNTTMDYRLVLRECSYAGPTGDGCAGTALAYDVNTDDAGVEVLPGYTVNGMIPK